MAEEDIGVKELVADYETRDVPKASDGDEKPAAPYQEIDTLLTESDEVSRDTDESADELDAPEEGDDGDESGVVEDGTARRTAEVETEPLDDGLVTRAVRAGFALSEIQRDYAGAPHLLERLVEAIEERENALSDAPKKKSKGIFDVREALGDKIDLLEPEQVELLESMDKAYQGTVGEMKSTIDELKKQVKDLGTTIEKQTKSTSDAEFYASLKGLDMPKLFGEKPSASMDGRSKEGRNMNRLKSEMEVIAAGRKAMSQPPLSRSDLMEKAVSSAFAKELKTVAHEDRERKRGHARGQALARANGYQGNAKALDPEERAVRTLERRRNTRRGTGDKRIDNLPE